MNQTKSKILTVFTPTFNRLYTLKRTYEWMRKQTCKDFIWLIIDDGSTDGTEQEVKKWLAASDKEFELRYEWKENGGLHTGYNRAIELTETELIVCIDSDDFMPENAVEIITEFWNKHRDNRYAGFIGLDYNLDNKPVGDLLPNVKSSRITDLQQIYHFKGDDKMVIRTELLKKYIPQPTYHGEKNFNPIYLLLHLDFNYTFLLLNKNLCYVDYQPNGMTASVFHQYLNSPNSFAALRVLRISLPNLTFTYKLRQYIHLASSICISRNFSWIRKSSSPILTILLLPLGLLLTLYIKIKVKAKC